MDYLVPISNITQLEENVNTFSKFIIFSSDISILSRISVNALENIKYEVNPT